MLHPREPAVSRPAIAAFESVTLGEPLWRLTKDGHTADARSMAVALRGGHLEHEIVVFQEMISSRRGRQTL
jgi:hypothetical protein